MRFKYILSALNLILKDFSPVVLLPLVVALYYHETSMLNPFLLAGGIAISGSLLIRKCVKLTSEEENLNDIKRSEALMVVSLSWIVISCIAAIPYLLYGMPIENSLFEAV